MGLMPAPRRRPAAPRRRPAMAARRRRRRGQPKRPGRPDGGAVPPVVTGLDSIRRRGRTIEYEVRRSKRRKKTMQITVGGDGVRVAVPATASNDDVREFVRRRVAWILEQVAASSARAARDRLVGGETLPYLGRDVRLVVELDDAPSPGAHLDEGSLVVTVADDLSGEQRSGPIRDAVMSWYRGRAEELLPAKVDRWLPRAVYYRPIKHPHDILMGREFLPHAVDDYLPRLGHATRPRVLIGNQKTLWGSCAHDGTIRLNWRAVMLEPVLIDYIVVHELAHLDVRDHSEDFWDQASKVLPDARGLRRRLREVERTLPWWTPDRR